MSDKPNILVFCCNWCSYAGADNAGIAKMDIKPYFKIVRTMCSSRIEPEMIIEAFKNGAWGVLVLGCHYGDCHYKNGNYKTYRKTTLLRKLLEQFGIEKERLLLDWVSANEAEKFANVINDAIDSISKLGPLQVNI